MWNRAQGAWRKVKSVYQRTLSHTPCALPPIIFHHVYKAIEKVRGIMRAGRGLRVKLNGDDGELAVSHALHRLIV